MSKGHNKQYGFTLVEVLVSLLVLSILGVVLAMAMGQVSQWQQKLLSEIDEGSAKLRFQALLMNDLLQLAPRSVADAYGGKLPACMSLPEGGFECSRFEKSIDGAGVVRFAYGVVEGSLWRWRYPVLDRAPATEPVRQLVLTPIDAMQVRWQDAQGVWQAQWPMAGEVNAMALPRQVEIVLMHKNQEQFRLWFPAVELMP
jgi:general secretion pathway protein J